jgi:hypothetical protein
VNQRRHHRDERRAAIERLDRLAWQLDAQWRIPGTSIRFGVDQVVSLVPVAGDVAGGLLAAHIVHQAARHGAPRRLLIQMIMNIGIDVTVGSVPVLGTVFDVFFKVSRINMALLRRHLEEAGEL